MSDDWEIVIRKFGRLDYGWSVYRNGGWCSGAGNHLSRRGARRAAEAYVKRRKKYPIEWTYKA